MNFATRLVLVLGLGSIVVLVMLTGFQRKMMFFPSGGTAQELLEAARTAGLEPWTANGQRIGWKAEPPAPSSNVIVFHGNAGNAVQRSYFLPIAEAAFPGSAIHILEYPGYADRKGSPSEDSLVEAAVEGIDELTSDSETPLYLVGESIGTGVASLAAAKRPDKIDGLLLITPFDSIANAAAIHYPMIPVHLILSDRFESAKALKGLDIPLYAVIAENDDVIPAKLGEQLYQGYNGPKAKLVVLNAGHNDVTLRVPDAEWRKIGAQLRAGLPGQDGPGN